MKNPFHRELDETFRSDRSVWLKMAGGAFATCFFVMGTLLRERGRGAPGIGLSVNQMVIVGSLAALAGGMLGLLLSLKDTVERRIRDGKPVSRLLVLYFARRMTSLFAWIVTLLVLASLVSMIANIISHDLMA